MNDKKCPRCKKSYYSVGNSTRTLAYYQPIYKNGVNINPDKNITTTNYYCLECGNDWKDSS